MTVIRRLDAVLESTKSAVLAMKKQLDDAEVANQHAALCQASCEVFYNMLGGSRMEFIAGAIVPR